MPGVALVGTPSAAAGPGHRRHSKSAAAVGALLVAMIALAVADGVGVAALGWAGGVCAWAAAIIQWRALATGQRRQCVALVGLGLAAMTWAYADGAVVEPGRLFDENLGLLAMIAGVSFIRLAAAPARAANRPSPRGPRALLPTLAGLNLLGAAINMTALVLVAERIAKDGRLGAFEASMLVRAFSLAVLYSPFIGGMAFALNLAPEANLASVVVYGIVLTTIGIGYIRLHAARTDADSLANFEGYPLRPDALWFPALLAGGVLTVHLTFGAVPVLTVIAVLAPVSACAVLLSRVGVERAVKQTLEHVLTDLPRMTGELWLFLCAGVLAAGLSSAFAAADFSLPIESLGGAAASGVLLLVILSGAAGLHPVIALSSLIPLLLLLDPPPELIVLLCVCGWSIGCSVCPYSGINLVVQARYGFDAWRFARRSWHYAAFMWFAASIGLCLIAGGL